ncbi:MAG: hypothetical protein ACI9W4_000898 [Rhodothermales bacterium]
MRRILPNLADSVPHDQQAALAGVTANYLEGRFDVLGSGWLRWQYGTPPHGREGHSFNPGPPVVADPEGEWLRRQVSAKNFPEARKLWRLIEGPYEPIDWQLDARSGARWSARAHTLDTSIGKRKGADVKVPWEVGRMHHLPRLALAHGQATGGAPGFQIASEYSRVYRNQVVDFMATNPPRYGANWATAMLSGIRIANILVAHDLFRAAGVTFDDAFERAVLRATREHADHILKNLDWLDLGERNNHYLANLAGLTFAAAYLPEDDTSLGILAFCRRELDHELEWQFNADGSHFEGSTAYHAFSAEMVGWTLALLGAMDAPAQAPAPRRIPSEARSRAFARETPRGFGEMRRALRPSLRFLADVQRPDGALLQVGDNDSGRFLRLDVTAECSSLADLRRRFLNLRELPNDGAPFWYEDQLDYREVGGVLTGLVADLPPVLTQTAETPSTRFLRQSRDTVSCHLATALLRSWKEPGSGQPADVARSSAVDYKMGDIADTLDELLALPGVRTCRQVFPDLAEKRLPGGLKDALDCVHYPDFGLTIFRSPLMWLSVRGGGRVRADGGHSHEDGLSFELHLDGRSYRVDPGAYVYTSIPWRRNQFRSHSAHGVPRLRSQGASDDGDRVFAPVLGSSGKIKIIGPDGLVGLTDTPDGRVYRVVKIGDDHVEITDLSADGQPIYLEPLPWWSIGYGHLTAFDPSCPSRTGGCAEIRDAAAPSRAKVERPLDMGRIYRHGAKHGAPGAADSQGPEPKA